MSKAYQIVFAVLAEPGNRKTLLNVCDSNSNFQALVWDALKATGVVVVTDARTPVKETIASASITNHRRAKIERALADLTTASPQLREQLGGRPLTDRFALERLVGLFMCMKLFMPAWQRAFDKVHGSDTDYSSYNGKGSLQGLTFVSGGSDAEYRHGQDEKWPMECVDLQMDENAGRFKRTRLSDESDTSKGSLDFSESSGSSGGGGA